MSSTNNHKFAVKICITSIISDINLYIGCTIYTGIAVGCCGFCPERVVDGLVRQGVPASGRHCCSLENDHVDVHPVRLAVLSALNLCHIPAPLEFASFKEVLIHITDLYRVLSAPCINVMPLLSVRGAQPALTDWINQGFTEQDFVKNIYPTDAICSDITFSTTLHI